MKQFLLSLLLCTVVLQGSSQNCSYNESVPDELYRGRYQLPGMTYGNPYTMFNRKDGWLSTEVALYNIRENIKRGTGSLTGVFAPEHEFSQVYRNIYLKAIAAEPGKCGEDEHCEHPQWVKSNAIVYLIDLEPYVDGNVIRFRQFTGLNRNTYGYNAFNGLSNLNPHVKTCNFGCGAVTEKSFDLILYLQAYDALKTSGYLLPYDEDRGDWNCSPRNKLRELTRNFYIEADEIINSTTGWKKNHGIICASALGMASMVLNDAGVETNWGRGLFGWLWGDGFNIPHPNYSPKNWHYRADGDGGDGGIYDEGGIEDNMFVGSHHFYSDNVPQTNSDGTAGYAEGPGYAAYLFHALLPYMVTAHNFVPDWAKWYVLDDRYKNILKWYTNILTEGEYAPTYDNSHLITGNYLGILGMSEWGGTSKTLPEDLYADYLLANAAKSTTSTKSKPTLEPKYVNDNSGNAVFRLKDGKDSKHYFHLLYEHDNAVDISAYDGVFGESDGTHEDEDLGSFMIGVDDTWLAIDPAYLGWENVEKTDRYSYHNVLYACGGLSNGFTNDVNDATLKVTEKTGGPGGVDAKVLELDIPISDGDYLREVNIINSDGIIYYLMNDKISTTCELSGKQLFINGNGNVNEYGANTHASDKTCMQVASTATPNTPSSTGRIFRWSHPCYYSEANWNLLAHVSVLNGASNVPDRPAHLRDFESY